MSTVQELLAWMIIAIILCFLFARISKNQKLFGKLVLTFVIGLVLGLGYNLVKEAVTKKADVPTETTVSNTNVTQMLNWIDITPTCNVPTLLASSVETAFLDCTSKENISTNNLTNESSGWKLRQLKIRCRGQT